MLSSRSYLLRAMHDWMVDSAVTPHLVVRGGYPGLVVPEGAVQDGKVILNIGPSAVQDLLIDSEFVSFVARFSGVSRAVMVPISAVEAIYARENGRGMMFSDDDEPAEGSAQSTEVSGQVDRPGPSLRVVK